MDKKDSLNFREHVNFSFSRYLKELNWKYSKYPFKSLSFIKIKTVHQFWIPTAWELILWFQIKFEWIPCRSPTPTVYSTQDGRFRVGLAAQHIAAWSGNTYYEPQGLFQCNGQQKVPQVQLVRVTFNQILISFDEYGLRNKMKARE